jgi:hypothetical protein
MPSTHLRTLSFSALLLGCVSCTSSVGITHSDFLPERQGFLPDPDEEGREIFAASQVDWSAYDHVLIEPLTIHLQATSVDKLNQEQSALLQENYNAFLLSALGDELTQVSEPGPRTFLVRSAITEVDTINLVLNWFTGLIVLWPIEYGGATFEVELTDSVSNQRLAAMVNADRATIWNGIGAMTRIGHACQAAEETAGWVGSLARQ